MELKRLEKGGRVRHNYVDGHGVGTITFLKSNQQDHFGVTVMWDSGKGPFPYTYNETVQEIVPL